MEIKGRVVEIELAGSLPGKPNVICVATKANVSRLMNRRVKVIVEKPIMSNSVHHFAYQDFCSRREADRALDLSYETPVVRESHSPYGTSRNGRKDYLCSMVQDQFRRGYFSGYFI